MPLVLELDWVQPRSPGQLWTVVLWSLAAACGNLSCFWRAGQSWAAGPGFTCAAWHRHG